MENKVIYTCGSAEPVRNVNFVNTDTSERWSETLGVPEAAKVVSRSAAHRGYHLRVTSVDNAI